MNYYERIQKSIDYCEQRLCEAVRVEDMARHAFMSVSGFHRMFFALTGYTAAEYLRCRRISLAAGEIKAGQKVLDTAVKYAYESADAFSRAFRGATGCLPSKYVFSETNYVFERINLMDKYYDKQDEKLLSQYPEIKVLKELPPMRVAYYCYRGKEPENGAFHIMEDWVNKQSLSLKSGSHRIFGYNAPDTQLSDTEYGYEVCVTLPENYEFQDERVKTKTLGGGKYVVCHVDKTGADIGDDIMLAWKRLNQWLAGSKYIYDGGTQWLEEHLEFDDDNRHTGGADLYMPVAPRSTLDSETEIVEREGLRVHAIAVTGRNVEKRGWEQAFAWVAEKGLEIGKCKLFSFYDYRKIGQKDFVFNMYISPDADNQHLAEGAFPGGMFAVRHTRYKFNGPGWYQFIEDINRNDKYAMDERPFMEMYELDNPKIDKETSVTHYMPVKHRL